MLKIFIKMDILIKYVDFVGIFWLRGTIYEYAFLCRGQSRFLERA